MAYIKDTIANINKKGKFFFFVPAEAGFLVLFEYQFLIYLLLFMIFILFINKYLLSLSHNFKLKYYDKKKQPRIYRPANS